MTVTKTDKLFFFPRARGGENPAGVTVSKRSELPSGDFRITEYRWGPASLWFVDDDAFDDDEREEAYEAFVFGKVTEVAG